MVKNQKIKTKTIKKPAKSKALGRASQNAKLLAGKPTPAQSAERYSEAVGRRKTSSARVRFLANGDKEILVNGKPYQSYFSNFELREIILSPLKLMNYLDKFRILIKVTGGGIHSQAEAVRHGIARVLVDLDKDFRKRLKKAGYLTRDSRMRERKKFGLKRARRAPQWRKR